MKRGLARKVEPSLRVRKDGLVFEKSSFWQRETVEFENLLHELRLNELRHFPCHFHQLRQCHGLEAISGIYPDILIPHFLALGRISTHTTHSHESNHITRRHPDTLVDSLIHTMVWFRDKLHLILMTCDSRTDSYSR